MISNMKDEDRLVFQMISGCCGDYEELEFDEETAISDYYPPEPRYNATGCKVIQFIPLPGYHSCLQAGGTKERHKEYAKKFGWKE